MKDTESYQQEECERVEEEGQGVKKMSFRSEIKKQFEKLESEVCKNKKIKIKHPRILRDEGKREKCEILYLNINNKNAC